MAIEDLDLFDIEFIDFYSELPSSPTAERDDKQDYIDTINTDITDLHESPDAGLSAGLSDKQVSQLAEDQFREAVNSRTDSSAAKDHNLFSNGF